MSKGGPEEKHHKPNSAREAKTEIRATEPILYESERNSNQSTTLVSKVAPGVEQVVSMGPGNIGAVYLHLAMRASPNRVHMQARDIKQRSTMPNEIRLKTANSYDPSDFALQIICRKSIEPPHTCQERAIRSTPSRAIQTIQAILNRGIQGIRAMPSGAIRADFLEKRDDSSNIEPGEFNRAHDATLAECRNLQNTQISWENTELSNGTVHMSRKSDSSEFAEQTIYGASIEAEWSDLRPIS